MVTPLRKREKVNALSNELQATIFCLDPTTFLSSLGNI